MAYNLKKGQMMNRNCNNTDIFGKEQLDHQEWPK
jgi:hypothetical protein